MERRNILVLLSLAVAAFLLYMACRGRASPETVLYQLESGESIERIWLENEHARLEFYAGVDGQWNVKEKSTYLADSTRMDLLLDSLGSLKVLRVLPGDDIQYGFEDYQASVSFETDHGNRHRFLLGGQTMNRSDYYLKDVDTGRVLITDGASASQLTGGMNAFRRKEIFSVQLDQLTSLQYRKGDQEITSVELDDSGQWHMKYPFVSQAREIPITEFINGMKDWNLYGYVEDTDGKEAGLDGDGEFLTLKDSLGNEQVLEFGVSDGTIMAVRNGGPSDVVLLYADEIHLDELEPEKLLLFAPFRNSIDLVDTIRIQIGGSEILMTIHHDTGMVSCNGRYLDMTAFNRFYVSFMGLSASGGEQSSVTAQGPVQAVIETGMADGSVIKTQFSYRDNMTYYMTLEGDTRYYMDRDRMERMLTRLEGCFDQQEIND